MGKPLNLSPLSFSSPHLSSSPPLLSSLSFSLLSAVKTIHQFTLSFFPLLFLSYPSFTSPTPFLPYLNTNQKSNPHPHPNPALWGSATAHQYGMLQLHDICLSGFNFLYLQTRPSFCALHCVALNCGQEKTII